ncbi:MAG: ATP-binding cassette domain-containing protein [Phycisphaerae bacterium]
MPETKTRAASRQRTSASDATAREEIPKPEILAPDGDVNWLTIRGAAANNLRRADAAFPLGRFTCVTGVSGSGKSSLVNDILYQALALKLNNATTLEPGAHDSIEGVEHLDKIIAIDQTPIGRTPRSNPATYIKVFDEIRNLFTKLPDSKLRGYKPGRFSFNVSMHRGGGRCEACEGNGANKIEMDFLADVWVTCPICEGHRFTAETRRIQYKGKSISDVLEMDVLQALEHFENIPKIQSMLQTLHDVGLDYLKLGQSSPTLSGGEAQRIKLARELVKKSTGRTIYVLDEPTTGLHFEDIRRLLNVLHGFVDAGNTVVVIEHNLDVIRTADWIIDLGPEGGAGGGMIVCEGTPDDIAAVEESFTGAALREFYAQAAAQNHAKTNGGKTGRNGNPKEVGQSGIIQPAESRSPISQPPSSVPAGYFDAVTVRGAQQHNLRNLDVSFPRNKTTVVSGVSGSGKTSFAIDTVFAEGYRRYVESLSSYARQFLGQLAKPRVEHVSGLSPAICIEQKAASKSPRSTVGTVTEIYDYLRVLWARVGTPHCTVCDREIGSQTVDEIVARVMEIDEGAPIMILAPLKLGDGEKWSTVTKRLTASGYRRVRVDGEIMETEHATTLDARRRHKVEVVVDRTVVRAKSRGRINESIEHALAMGSGVMMLLVEAYDTVHHDHEVDSEALAAIEKESPLRDADGESTGVATNQKESTPEKIRAHENTASEKPKSARTQQNPEKLHVFSQRLACTHCGISYEELGPHEFSFNAHLGWCESCEGLGIQRGAPASQIIVDPTKSILNGAISGWRSITPTSGFGKLLAALCDRIGVDVKTPLVDWTTEQRQILLYGTRGDAIDGEVAYSRVRFQWRGFFPTIDNVTRNSWSLRRQLHHSVTDIACTACRGGRIRKDAAAVRLANKTIVEMCEQPLEQVAAFFEKLRLDARQKRIAGELLVEVRNRLQFLLDVGLEYLHLHRAAPTLSGGEAQRIRLASQIGSGLSGVIYVLDEPTIGLHPRDNARLIRALHKLRDLGNTLLIVEHDREVISSADHLIDFGPQAGRNGGRVVWEDQPAAAKKIVAKQKAPESLTRAYLAEEAAIAIPENRRPVQEEQIAAALQEEKSIAAKSGKRRRRIAKRDAHDIDTAGVTAAHDWLFITGAREHNLKNLDVPIPLARFTCVTGVSGSGKSSLVNDILWPALANRLNRASLTIGAHEQVLGDRHIDKIINVDQAPIGNTPSSNPATYTGVFDLIRELFARLPESKMRGYAANRFSFNRPGGRCDACEGNGQKCIEMHFMADVWVTCEICNGKRYNPETLQIQFKGKSIADVLEMSVGEALQLFDSVPKVRRMLQTLADVGLEYVPLGQSATTLSGGEAQRVKLASELGKPDTGRTLYLLDEPSTGLHFDDVRKLLNVMHRLVDLGNTVICVEHNLDIIKNADWIIDLGPEAGAAGGEIVALGTPETICSSAKVEDRLSACPTTNSHTAAALAPVLKAGPHETRARYDAKAHAEKITREEKAGFGKVGKDVKMPWQEDGKNWHLVQRTSRADQPCRWEPAALEYVVDLIQKSGDFAETNWNNRASIEIIKAGAPTWFFHALTGGEWLLELYFRVPPGTIKASKLDAALKLKTLDQREDLQTYGDWARVDVRSRRDGLDAVVIYVHDKKEIDTPAFRKFVKEAVRLYQSAMK